MFTKLFRCSDCAYRRKVTYDLSSALWNPKNVIKQLEIAETDFIVHQQQHITECIREIMELICKAH